MSTTAFGRARAFFVSPSGQYLWSVAKWLPFGVFVNECVVSVHPIEGTSMQPTLNAVRGQREWVLANHLAAPVRGDVILLSDPSKYGDLLIKRVVGMPGDWVKFPDMSHPNVYVKQGMMWVEGDNKNTSRDSHEFGPVPAGLVRARVSAVVWPPSNIRIVERTYATDRVFHPFQ